MFQCEACDGALVLIARKCFGLYGDVTPAPDNQIRPMFINAALLRLPYQIVKLIDRRAKFSVREHAAQARDGHHKDHRQNAHGNDHLDKRKTSGTLHLQSYARDEKSQ